MTVWLDKVKACISWDAVDRDRVSKLCACLDSDLHEVVEAIGSCLVQFKDTQPLMTNARFVQRLHSVLREWLTGPLAGEFDEAYAQTRWALVRKLMEVDLTFEDIILIEGLAREQLLKLAQARLGGGTEDLSTTMHTLDKALRLDMALIHGGYTQVRDAEIERATLDRFLAITGFSRTLYENLAEAREWSDVSLRQSGVR
ncbi:MAG: hypothetical protein JXA14_01080 [Anaerolineae bacterium]|nr:hypothetical protein [Anaerolineae bacterium]